MIKSNAIKNWTPLLLFLTASSVCMCQTNVVLTKQEYEKLLSQRNKARKELMEVSKELIVYKDSITRHRIVEVDTVERVTVSNDCEEFKRQLLGLKQYNKSLIATNTKTSKHVRRLKIRLRPQTYKDLGGLGLLTYLIYRTVDDVYNHYFN